MTKEELRQDKYIEVVKYNDRSMVHLIRCKLCFDVLYNNDLERGQVTESALADCIALHLMLKHDLGIARRRRR